MSSKRLVRVDREGRFEIAGTWYTLMRNTSVLLGGLWEVWPDGNADRAVVTARSYREARDEIDEAAKRGGFRGYRWLRNAGRL